MLLILILAYAVLAFIVTFVSIKLANYVDIIDRKTDMSGAFIGGVILAAVTSLPELFTSISAVTIVKDSSLVFGNILGSNIFNFTILAAIVLFSAKGFARNKVGTSHLRSTLIILFLFVLMFFANVLNIDFTIWHISIFSIIIVATYFISLKGMANDETQNDEETDSKLTNKQIAVRFIILAVILVSASIVITMVTDELSAKIGLGATVAGALFLGVATSLPELSSTITLSRKGNYNAACGNIVGSGTFNFVILSVADILDTKGSVYSVKGSSSLVVFGLIATLLTWLLLFYKANRKLDESKKVVNIYRVLAVGVLTCYALFLILS